MMFKTEQIGKDWSFYVSPYPERNKRLKRFVKILDDISKLVGENEVVVTDYLRYGKENIHSLHHADYGCAVDIRVRNKSTTWYFMMTLVGIALALVDPKIRMNAHYEDFRKNNQHIHCEIRR